MIISSTGEIIRDWNDLINMEQNNLNQHCSNKNCTLTKEQFEQVQKHIGSLDYGYRQEEYYQQK